MRDSCEILLLLSFLLLLRTAAGQDNIRPPNSDNGGRCEALSSTVCANVGYDSVYLPNARGHDTQADAELEIRDFNQLISSGCSDALFFLLCSYYFPLCFTDPINNQAIKVRTCRSLCEFVQPLCEPNLLSVNLPWPVFLNCSLDDFSDEAPCFGPPNLNNLTVSGTNAPIDVMSTQGQPTTVATVTPTVTLAITSTPPPQSTTRQGNVLTTTNSANTDVANLLSLSLSALTAVIVLSICY